MSPEGMDSTGSGNSSQGAELDPAGSGVAASSPLGGQIGEGGSAGDAKMVPHILSGLYPVGPRPPVSLVAVHHQGCSCQAHLRKGETKPHNGQWELVEPLVVGCVPGKSSPEGSSSALTCQASL